MDRSDTAASDSPYAELLQVALRAADAGSQALQAWRGKFATREKSPADLVTDADLAAQRAISEVVAGRFPEHAFLGEEDPQSAAQLLAEPVCWVVDPLDGTTNYVHGFPTYAVSIGVVAEGEIVVGVIADPNRQEVYSAVADGGAWCNGARLRASDTARLVDALVAVSLPPHVDRQTPDLVDLMAVVGRCQGVRRTGSAALNLAQVAAGTLDAHWARHIHPWDVAAGVLLIREAGGVVTASDGGPLDLRHPHFLAAGSRALHAELLELLNQPGSEGDE